MTGIEHLLAKRSPRGVTKNTTKQMLGEKNAQINLMTPAQTGQYLSLSEGWLAKLRIYGGGPQYVKLKRRILYRREDLDAWVASQIQSNTSQNTSRPA